MIYSNTHMENRNDAEIAVVITAYNEEQNIKECIYSAMLLTPNVVLIDTESTDGTRKRAEELNITVYTFPYSQYVEPSRVFAIEKAQAEWVFILDADERITPELAQEIRSSLKSDLITHFMVPRKNIIARTKWLQYGGWYPDNIIRIIQKKNFVTWPPEIHSTPKISGQSSTLQNPLEHYFQPSLEYMVSKTGVYEDMESTLLYKASKQVSVLTFFRKFFGELARRLIMKRGFMDGTYGVIESIYQAYSKTITYMYLYEKYKKSTLI